MHQLHKISSNTTKQGYTKTIYEDKARDVKVEIKYKKSVIWATREQPVPIVMLKVFFKGKRVLDATFCDASFISNYIITDEIPIYMTKTTAGKIEFYGLVKGAKKPMNSNEVLFALVADKKLQFKPMNKKDFMASFNSKNAKQIE